MQFQSIKPMGDTAITVHFGEDITLSTHRKVLAFCTYLDEHDIPGLLEYVPAFNNVTLYYDVAQVSELDSSRPPHEQFGAMIARSLVTIEPSAQSAPQVIEIPVCYGGEFGPDLEHVAAHNDLTVDEVIAIHAGGEYVTYMLGFAPGFPYLGGMSEQIATPRRKTPRLTIPPGTVGIAGKQTGVYPLSSPGGWQLIGRTPLALFRPDRSPPTLIQMGNLVKFKPISRQQYEELAQGGAR